MSYGWTLLFVWFALAGRVEPKSVEQRAVELIAPVAARDGFVLDKVSCFPWRGTSLCDLCYTHPKERWLGYARVWCDKSRCEWIIDESDPRKHDSNPDRCFARGKT